MTQTSTELLDTGSWIDHPKVVVNRERCAGCQECVIRCPSGALSIDPVDWKASADSSLCVGCRQCTRTCPFSAIDVYGGMVVDERIQLPLAHPTSLKGDISETRPGLSSWDQALSEASRCLSCPDPTCVRGCPAHNDIPSIHHGDQGQGFGACSYHPGTYNVHARYLFEGMRLRFPVRGCLQLESGRRCSSGHRGARAFRY